MKLFAKLIVAVGLFTILVAGGLWWWLGPPQKPSQPGVFSVREDTAGFFVADMLGKEHYIKHPEAWRWLYIVFVGDKKVLAGGYRLNQNMNAWQVLKKITGKPELVWVTVPEGVRKEQIGEILAARLGWNPEEEKKWDEVYTNTKPEYVEGVYFPDTYLLPLDENGALIAQRFIDRFNQKFAPLADGFLKKNIKWTTGLKIASLIQREAAGPGDMPLISGIIWNRMEQGMKLEIDATMQYTRGKHENGWWGPVNLDEKLNDSPYNTYIYKGLPPTPICNPGLAAIEAALDPEETDCLFYLHDAEKQIHCAATYAGHQVNIQKYL